MGPSFQSALACILTKWVRQHICMIFVLCEVSIHVFFAVKLLWAKVLSSLQFCIFVAALSDPVSQIFLATDKQNCTSF